MKTYVAIQIDPQEVFDKLTSNEQQTFIAANLLVVSDDELVTELECRGYNVNLEKRTREEDIKNAANEYSKNIDYSDYADMDVYDVFIAGAEWSDKHPTIFNRCVNKQSPDYNDGYEQGRKDANPEIVSLEHEIERLKSKLQAADDLNTLLTAELEKVGCSSK